MSYEIKKNDQGSEVSIQAADRASLFKDAVTAYLEVIYRPLPWIPDPDGRAFPVQVSGTNDKDLLEDILDAVGDAAASHAMAFLAPRWVSFDQGRATVNLPLAKKESEPRLSRLIAARDLAIEDSGATARLQFSPGA
ncbi:MAG: hypothetical protein L6R30_03460 [Thermoanaerobaculia bacterium]|nr:hypothetical protein [Thermoanaerobaculia bacterium]